MVERDVAEFVDDDGGFGKRFVLEQAVEQRGLAGAEKAGKHGQRNGLGRPAPRGAIGGGAHRLAELTFGLAACRLCLGVLAVLASPPVPSDFLATCLFFFFERGSAVCTASG